MNWSARETARWHDAILRLRKAQGQSCPMRVLHHPVAIGTPCLGGSGDPIMNVVIVGAGRRGIVHGRAAAAFSGTEVVGVVDPDTARASALASEIGGEAFTDHRQALEMTQPQAVFLTSPPPLHVDQAIDAIGVGATVMIEKPVAFDLAEVARLRQVATTADRLVMVCQQHRYATGAARTREALAGRKIALIHTWGYRQKPDIKANWHRAWGGGHIVENQIHPLDLTRYLLGDRGEPISMYARYNESFYEKSDGWDNWDSYSVSFECKRGAVGSVATTYGAFPGIQGSWGHDIVAEGLVVKIRGHNFELLFEDGTVETIASEIDPTITIAHAFLNASRTGDHSALRQDYDDAARSLEICLAANTSAMTGQVVKLA